MAATSRGIRGHHILQALLSCFLLLTLYRVQAFSSGSFSESACGSGPLHGSNAQEAKPPFIISVLSSEAVETSTYRPGEIMTVRIKSVEEGVLVKGFLMWAAPAGLMENYCPLGKWIPGIDQQRKSCDLGSSDGVVCDLENNAVAHKNRLDVSEVEALFLVPTEQTDPFVFRAHVVNNFTTFWFSIESGLLSSVDKLGQDAETLLLEKGKMEVLETSGNLTDAARNFTADIEMDIGDDSTINDLTSNMKVDMENNTEETNFTNGELNLTTTESTFINNTSKDIVLLNDTVEIKLTDLIQNTIEVTNISAIDGIDKNATESIFDLMGNESDATPISELNVTEQVFSQIQNGTDLSFNMTTMDMNSTLPEEPTTSLTDSNSTNEEMENKPTSTDITNATLISDDINEVFSNETHGMTDMTSSIPIFNETQSLNQTESLPEQTFMANNGTETLTDTMNMTEFADTSNETNMVFNNDTELTQDKVTLPINETEQFSNETTGTPELTTVPTNETVTFANGTESVIPETDFTISNETVSMVSSNETQINFTTDSLSTTTMTTEVNETDFENNPIFSNATDLLEPLNLTRTTEMASDQNTTEVIIDFNVTDSETVDRTTMTSIEQTNDTDIQEAFNITTMSELEQNGTDLEQGVTTTTVSEFENNGADIVQGLNTTTTPEPEQNGTDTQLVFTTMPVPDDNSTDTQQDFNTTTMPAAPDDNSTDTQQVFTTTTMPAPDDNSTDTQQVFSTTTLPEPEQNSTEITTTNIIPVESSTTTTTTTTSTTTTTTTTTTSTTTTTPELTTEVPVKESDKNTDQPILISFKLEGDFDQLVGPDPEKAKAELTTQLADIMEIDQDRVKNIELSKGSVAVEFTVEPSEDGSGPTTDEARAKLEDHLSNGGGLEINGKELRLIDGTLTSTAESKAGVKPEPERQGISVAAKIALSVVFGLIGLAIIITIIVIVLRQRSNHGFLVMRQTRKEQDMAMHNMGGNGRNGNGYQNQGYSHP